MIEVAIVFDVERDTAPVVGTHRHVAFADTFDRPKRAVLDLQAALIAQEHDAVAGCKTPVSAPGLDANIAAQFARRVHPLACHIVKLTHLGIGVGEDNPAGIGVRLPVAIPAIDRKSTRLNSSHSCASRMPSSACKKKKKNIDQQYSNL